MSAISELFGFAIYFFLIIGSVIFFVSAWLSRAKSKRTIYTILAILFLVISIVSFVSSKMAFHKWESGRLAKRSSGVRRNSMGMTSGWGVRDCGGVSSEGVQITVSSRFEKLRTLQIKNHSYEEA